MAPGTAVKIQVLGPVRAWLGGRQVDLGGAGRRTLLALLATTAGHPVSRAELVDALWRDDPPLSTVNVIHTYVRQLRQALEPHRRARAPSAVLPSVGDGYALDLSTVELDLVRFRCLVAEALRARQEGDQHRAAVLLGDALGLWQGPPLAGAAVLVHHPRAVALAAERWAAAGAYGELLLAIGATAEAATVLEEAVAAHPLDEAAQARLIRAYRATGRRAQAFAVYHDARRRLADELGVAPGTELSAAYAALLGDEGMPPVSHPIPTTPAQLPPANSGFTGRANQVAQLDSLLPGRGRTAAVVICAISGVGGIGKTTLAVQWAHRVAHRFPDGQLFVDLRGSTGLSPRWSTARAGAAPHEAATEFGRASAAMSPSEAVRLFLDALSVPPERVPHSLDAQVNLYRSLTAGRRMLVVLDNARDADQVRPLLPGSPGSLVLVTSRDRLTGLVAAEGAWPVPLDPLSPAEARRLLVRRIGVARTAAERPSVAAIVDQCAGLPLALASVAAQAATHPETPLTALATTLRRPPP